MPGNKWYYSFLKRHKSISVKHAEYVNKARGNVSEENIRKWFQDVSELLDEYLDMLKDPSF